MESLGSQPNKDVALDMSRRRVGDSLRSVVVSEFGMYEILGSICEISCSTVKQSEAKGPMFQEEKDAGV